MHEGLGTVLFDIDGTLVDSTYFHALAWWRACRAAGETIPMSRLHRLVGMGSDTLTKTVFGEERKDIADAEGREYKRFEAELTPLPGATRLLEETARAGLKVVLASSAREEQIPRLREVLEADDAVSAVTTSADAEQSKPQPDIFAAAMQRVDANRETTLAVGDTKWDIEAAKRLGLPCIGLLCGGWSKPELIEAGAAEVFQDPADLLDNFAGSLIGRLASGSR